MRRRCRIFSELTYTQSYPSLVDSPPSPPKHHEMWKRFRQRRTSDYTSEGARIVVEKTVNKYSILIIVLFLTSLHIVLKMFVNDML